jgi:uncharacterized membrane protein (UPF0127 family)
MNPFNKAEGAAHPSSTSRQQPTLDARLHVSNLTRSTVLATCLEVADSGAKRNKGLLGRKGLAPGEGLWIVPCESVHTFFMQFPIDLVYLDRKNRIRKVCDSVPPWRLSACFSAHSILELPSGTIRSTQTQPGDMLEFSPAASAADSAADSASPDQAVS